jgi:hypothetical protein
LDKSRLQSKKIVYGVLSLSMVAVSVIQIYNTSYLAGAFFIIAFLAFNPFFKLEGIVAKIQIILRVFYLFILSIFLILASLWALLFKTYVILVFAFLGFLLVLPVFPKFLLPFKKRLSEKFTKNAVLYGVLILFIILSAVYFMIRDLDFRMYELESKLYTKEGIDSYTTRDLAGIWGLNFFMGVTGYLLYPEVAIETLYMIIESEKGEREFSDGFFIKSKKIENEIEKFEISLKENDQNEVRMAESIYWESYGGLEGRYALALNCPAYLKMNAFRDGDFWLIEMTVDALIEYPKRANVRLLNFKTIGLQLMIREGLFWVLQEKKWLHPYNAKWKHSYVYKNR